MKTFRSSYPKTWALAHGVKWLFLFGLVAFVLIACAFRALEFLIYCHGPGKC